MFLARGTLLSAALISLGLAAAACGGSGPAATPVPTETPLTVDQVVARSGAVMNELSTFRFKLSHEVGTSAFLPGIQVEDTVGRIHVPNKLEIEFTGLFGDFPINVDFIAIDDVNYMTNPLTDVWEVVDTEVSPIAFFKPDEGIRQVLSSISEGRFEGRQGDVHRIAGRMPAESLGPLMGETVEGNIVDVELEFDAESFHLTWLRIAGRVIPSDDPEVVRIVTLSHFDQPVMIEAPEIIP